MHRLIYLALAIGTIVAGLIVHGLDSWHPTAAGDIAGDGLWAMLVVWLVSAIAPRARIATRASVAFGIAVAVECSQLYHTAGLDAIRATTLGRLVLGTGFDARDILAYAGGVLIAALLQGAVTTTAEHVRPADRR